jgi:hypothetical protein
MAQISDTVYQLKVYLNLGSQDFIIVREDTIVSPDGAQFSNFYLWKRMTSPVPHCLLPSHIVGPMLNVDLKTVTSEITRINTTLNYVARCTEDQFDRIKRYYNLNNRYMDDDFRLMKIIRDVTTGVL